MWLFAYVPAVFGVLRYRRWSYWRWVTAVFVAVCAGEFLFSARGTLDRPEGDGLVVQAVRRATNDGPEMALTGLVFLALFWGGVIFCGRQLYVEARRLADEAAPIKPAGGLRKMGELILLSLILAALVFVGARSAAMRTEIAAADAALEANLDLNVAAINATTPRKLDDMMVLTGAAREGRTLTLDHEVTNKAVGRAALSAYLQDRKPAEICARDDVRRLLDEGGTWRLRYVLASDPGSPLVVEFGPKTCAERADPPLGP